MTTGDRQLQRTCNVFGKPVYEKAMDAEGKHANISTWHYDGLGRIVRAVCDGRAYEYVYDAQGHLKEKRSSGKRLVSYTYDRAGNRIRRTDAKGATLCQFNRKNQLTEVVNDDSKNQFTYDRQGGIVEEFCRNPPVLL